MFHENPQLDSPAKMMMSLVSMIAGDETVNTMRKTALYFGLRGYVFTYLYQFCFFIMIKNVIIFLITSTFMKQLKDSKKRGKKSNKYTGSKKKGGVVENVKLHRGNMVTTRMLRTRDKELAKDRFKARTKYMFEANMEQVKTEIE